MDYSLAGQKNGHSQQHHGFSGDIHTSNTPAIAGLFLFGVAVGVLGGRPFSVGYTVPFALAFMALASIALLLNRRNLYLSSLFLTSGLFTIILFAVIWLKLPEVFFLFVIPPLLSFSLCGKLPAAILGILSSFAIFAIWYFGLASVSPLGAATATVVLWSVLLSVFLMNNRTQNLLRWSWERYRQSLDLLEDARTHRGELLQITKDLVHATQQLSLMNEKLAAARQAAEEAQRAKAAFVANVSHEFRTPLNMIIGLTDLLMENPGVYGSPLPPALLEDIGIVLRNCEHLSAMIDDVLDLSQVEAGKVALHKQRVNLLEVIERAISVVKPLTDKKKLPVSLYPQSEIPEVYCDRDRVRQVIVNLLGNSARFTETGKITIDIWTEQGDVVVRIKDTGPGIDPENIRKLFQPFSQFSYGSSQSSSGLGLAISKQFVELHGGKMWAESVLGEGSAFSFRLPIDPSIGQNPRPGSKLVEDWVWYERLEPANLPVNGSKKRVVFWDETGDFYPLFSRYLDHYEFIETSNIVEAEEECKNSSAYALMLNALHPEKLTSAVETVCRTLPDLPVIGFSFPRRAEAAYAAGAIGYLVKPINKTILQKGIQGIGKPVKKILLVDDHLDELTLLKRILRTIDDQLQVETAASGKETLEKLRRDEFDLLLLDVVMPDMDGWQVLDLMTRDPSISNVPTVMLSGKDPSSHPVSSGIILAGVGGGLSFGKAIKGFQSLSAILTQAE